MVFLPSKIKHENHWVITSSLIYKLNAWSTKNEKYHEVGAERSVLQSSNTLEVHHTTAPAGKQTAVLGEKLLPLSYNNNPS